MPRISLQSMIAAIAVMGVALALPAQAQPLVPAAPPADAALPVLNLPPAIPPTGAAPLAESPAMPQPVAAIQPSVATEAAAALAPPATATKVYSFGDSNLSILFLPSQVSSMQNALRSFEDSGKDAAAPTARVIDSPKTPVAEVIEDPLVYPVFYLASVAYDDPKDWSLWLSGYKITSRKNDTDVRVLNVTADSATFLWTPSFGKAIAKRKSDKLFAPVDDVKSKLAAIQRVTFDAGTGSAVFTLKTNQSFAVGYFKTFEGYIDGPTLTALPTKTPESSSVLSAIASSANTTFVNFDTNGQAVPSMPLPMPPNQPIMPSPR